MFPSFVKSVLGTPKQRTRFLWFRCVVTGGTGLYAAHLIGGAMGALIGVLFAAISFYTLAPVVALLICFFEQMLS